jgi:hypothetical protein
MQALQRSPLKLADDELSKLREHGFVISNRKRFPGFTDGWLAIFKGDMPLYVSADALLHVIHRSYDRMLQEVEGSVLVPRLQGLLTGMREHLSGAEGASLSSQARADADLFTAVALGLLEGRPIAPVAGADAGAIATWVDQATAAKGFADKPLFGSTRSVDFSQFRPRGHYAQSSFVVKPGAPTLAAYFRAMMWLGRIDARITMPDRRGVLELHRRELELACALRALLGLPEMAAWQQLEATMNAFVGPRDAMGPADVDKFYRDLGIRDLGELAHVSDAKILATMTSGEYGQQRIRSDIFFSHTNNKEPAPLPNSFSLTGQRYIVDSHVLSDLVHDKVRGRMMPSPLDVAFAVLKNDQARAQLHGELDTYHYAADLTKARDRVEANGEPFWESSLYNLWLGAMRSLSSAPGANAHVGPLMQSEAWGRRLMSTQLASWAELRHDTILYAKQSYTGSIACSFPDAYVDPYPAFYDKLAKFAGKGQALLSALDFGKEAGLSDQMKSFFDLLADVAAHLGHIAQEEVRGERPSKEELAFINEAVFEDPPRGGGCGPPIRRVRGWYIRLFFGGEDPLAFKPTIADVHTQPTDQGGNMVGKVLHVGTGWPRLMVVDIDTGKGPSPFVGVVSTYSEIVTDNFQRYTDEEWARAIAGDNAEDVPWMRDLVVR